jgi:putative oxidoreductase
MTIFFHINPEEISTLLLDKRVQYNLEISRWRRAMDGYIENSSPDIGPRRITSAITGGLTILGLLAVFYATATMPEAILPLQAKTAMVLALSLSATFTFVLTPRNFVAGFLLGLLLMLIGWRVTGLLGVTVASYVLLIALVAFAGRFLEAAQLDLTRSTPRMSLVEWHIAFVRIYLGFAMVPHFTEKLFAGSGSRLDDVSAFASFGLPWPEAFVFVGGLCELGIAIGIGMGLLTRFAGICAALYFFIATLIGGHFLNGFIWVSPNGGWEYPVLMTVLYLSFSIYGAGAFSLDRVLMDRSLFPVSLRMLALPSINLRVHRIAASRMGISAWTIAPRGCEDLLGRRA